MFIVFLWYHSFQNQVVSHTFTNWNTKASGSDYTNCLVDSAYPTLNVLTQSWFSSSPTWCTASQDGIYSDCSGGP